MWDQGHMSTCIVHKSWPAGEASGSGQWCIFCGCAESLPFSRFLCHLPQQEWHIMITLSIVVCCCGKQANIWLYLPPSTCFDGFQPKLGHRCNRGTLICWLGQRSQSKIKRHLKVDMPILTCIFFTLDWLTLTSEMHFVKFHSEVTSCLLSRGKRKYAPLGMRLLWKYVRNYFLVYQLISHCCHISKTTKNLKLKFWICN